MVYNYIDIIYQLRNVTHESNLCNRQVQLLERTFLTFRSWDFDRQIEETVFTLRRDIDSMSVQQQATVVIDTSVVGANRKRNKQSKKTLKLRKLER